MDPVSVEQQAALRKWTVEGEVPLVITIHRPAVTLRCGDGPEVRLTPKQVNALCCQLDDAEAYFLEEAPLTIS
ncbi:hypothetical protein [Fodinicola feengrottensis]|uniref:Uncharacterized protein n=1 Tax=Fodinicola feengrottensis TaxID=435914 RepID=A0ABN2HH41_9ACTN|nr:hypothetical protein [Fodinicola feengrottensis]